jgi:nucleoside-diphosphate-sugar epimerase
MARFLVTGGGGFIGSNLVEALLRRGHDVRVLDDFSTGRRENLAQAAAWAAGGGGHFELLEGDVRDPATCRSAVGGCDFVLHQAAIPSVQRSVENPVLTHEVNVDGTLRLLLACREAGVRRFVYASSSSVYGDTERLPKEESMPASPLSPYALQKLAGETYCVLFHRLYGFPAVALRYFNVFGPRQDPSSEYAAVIPRFMSALKNGRRPVVFGDGEQSRDFTFVEDVVRANLLACEAPPEACGRAYNIAAGRRTTLKQLLAILFELSGRRAEPIHEPPRPADVRHSLASIEAAARELGYRPEVDLREGLRRTWEAL